jgi:Uncharacterised protein family (UPF0236)
MASQDLPPHDPKQDEREARLQQILQQMEQQLRAGLPDPHQPLERIEQEVVEIGRALREIIERETLAAAGSGYVGSQAVCACGRPARSVTRNRRTLVTLNGERTFARAYYHCAACGQGFCPLDQRWQLGRGEQSVGVRALAARFNSYVSERKAAVELELVTGIRLSPRRMQRAGVAVGAALAAEWAERKRQLFAHPVAPPARRPGQLHGAMEACSCSSAGTGGRPRWARCINAGRTGGGAHPVLRHPGRLQRVRAAHADGGAGEGIDYCRERALLGDGAEWIGQEGVKHFPRTDEIVDLFHVLEHLWAMARARFPSAAAQKTWVDAQKKRLLANGVKKVIRAVAGWKTSQKEEAKLKRETAGYLRTHAHRMQYQTYAAQGYHLGSGVAQAGCKQVVQARMKGAGMRWGEVGAEAMLHLRAAVCSTDPVDFRVAARRAALPS